MTPRQDQCLAFLKAYIEVRGYSPSYEEIRLELGLKSNSGVHRIVHGLEAGGYIEIRPYLRRSIRIKAPVEDRLREALKTAPSPTNLNDLSYSIWYDGARKEALCE